MAQFGLNTVGANSAAGQNNNMFCSKFTNAPAGTLTKVYACVKSPTTDGSRYVRVALYADNAGALGDLIANTDSGNMAINRTTDPTSDLNTWTSANITNGFTMTEGATYWIAYDNNNADITIYWDTVTNGCKYAGLTYSSFPPASGAPVVDVLNDRFSVCYEYTTSAATEYTMQDVTPLPSTDAALSGAFTAGNYTSVGSDDTDRVTQQSVGQYAVFEFKNLKNNGQEHPSFSVKWNGQSDRSPQDSTVTLQIYNYNSAGWDVMDSDNTTAANTDFDLEGSISANQSYYFDTNGRTVCRVYQQAV